MVRVEYQTSPPSRSVQTECVRHGRVVGGGVTRFRPDGLTRYFSTIAAWLNRPCHATTISCSFRIVWIIPHRPVSAPLFIGPPVARQEIGRGSCRERVWQYVSNQVV